MSKKYRLIYRPLRDGEPLKELVNWEGLSRDEAFSEAADLIHNQVSDWVAIDIKKQSIFSKKIKRLKILDWYNPEPMRKTMEKINEKYGKNKEKE